MGIGKNNALPWHHPEDLKKFKEITQGKTVIMGRNTYESIGRPLPNRANIVISSKAMQSDYPEGVGIVRSLEYALSLCRNQDEVFIIGGQSLYEQALPLCDKLYLTHIEGEHDCDAFFPEWDIMSFDQIHFERLSEVATFTVEERIRRCKLNKLI